MEQIIICGNKELKYRVFAWIFRFTIDIIINKRVQGIRALIYSEKVYAGAMFKASVPTTAKYDTRSVLKASTCNY